MPAGSVASYTFSHHQLVIEFDAGTLHQRHEWTYTLEGSILRAVEPGEEAEEDLTWVYEVSFGPGTMARIEQDSKSKMNFKLRR